MGHKPIWLMHRTGTIVKPQSDRFHLTSSGIPKLRFGFLYSLNRVEDFNTVKSSWSLESLSFVAIRWKLNMRQQTKIVWTFLFSTLAKLKSLLQGPFILYNPNHWAYITHIKWVYPVNGRTVMFMSKKTIT